jgi:hypothetical protein
VVKHRSPLGPLLVLLPVSMYGSSLSVSVQTGIFPNGPSCSMLAITSASCSSLSQVAAATSSATASFGDLFGSTEAGASILYDTLVGFDTSYSEMLTIIAGNHTGTGTLTSRFELIVSSNAIHDAFIKIGINQGQTVMTADSFRAQVGNKWSLRRSNLECHSCSQLRCFSPGPVAAGTVTLAWVCCN